MEKTSNTPAQPTPGQAAFDLNPQRTDPMENAPSAEELQRLAATPADDLTPEGKAEFEAAMNPQQNVSRETSAEPETTAPTETPEETPPVEGEGDKYYEFQYRGSTVQVPESELTDVYDAYVRQKEMQGDYTRKTTELSKYRGILELIEGDPVAREYIGLRLAGRDSDSSLQTIYGAHAPKPEPDVYVVDNNSGQQVLNPKWLEWRDERLLQKVQPNRQQQQAQPTQQPTGGLTPMGYANGQIANSAARIVARQYGLDISNPATETQIYDSMEQVLNSQRMNINTDPLTVDDFVKAFEQGNQAVVKKAQIAATAKANSGKQSAPTIGKTGGVNAPALQQRVGGDPIYDL